MEDLNEEALCSYRGTRHEIPKTPRGGYHIEWNGLPAEPRVLYARYFSVEPRTGKPVNIAYIANSGGWDLLESTISTDEYKSRRARLCERIGSAHALVAGAPAPNDRAPFRQYNDFCYLCGVEVPQSYLMMDGGSGRTTLFLPERGQQSRERNDELLLAGQPDEVKALTGVDEVQSRTTLKDALDGVRTLYTFLRDGEGLKCDERSIVDAQRQIDNDPWDGRPNRGAYLVERIRAGFPQIEIEDLAPIILDMRLTKSTAEIALLRRAGQLSAAGLVDAIRSTRPGVMEYELAAVLQYHYVAGGASDNSYAPIVASGPNIIYPHYCANNCELCDGDLVLVDCAPDYHYYTSDITRMWPVNGTYTPAQRALYGFVTEYHKTLLSGLRPGRSCSDIEDEAGEGMLGRIGEFAFASPTHRAAAEKMCQSRNHIAHSVGMSVHDGLGHKSGTLAPGMVFAVDPQLWLREEGIYIRVEDTGVVTDDGFEIFTKDAPLELPDIEAMVTGEGIVQAFPPAESGRTQMGN
jgi:Xaa-Pro aminopeptidase